MKLKVRKRRDFSVRTVDGKVIRNECTYYIAVRKYWVFWFGLKFYIDKRLRIEERASRILSESFEIHTSAFMGSKDATGFPEEADAVAVKLDIMQHPEKYVRFL